MYIGRTPESCVVLLSDGSAMVFKKNMCRWCQEACTTIVECAFTPPGSARAARALAFILNIERTGASGRQAGAASVCRRREKEGGTGHGIAARGKSAFAILEWSKPAPAPSAPMAGRPSVKQKETGRLHSMEGDERGSLLADGSSRSSCTS